MLWLVLASGCRHPAGKPRVVTTLFPVYDLTRRIAGPDADVELLLPPGTSPEGFVPGPDVEPKVAGARLAVTIGLDLDPWLAAMMTRVSPKGRVLRLADRVPTLPRPDSAAPGAPAAVDVHVWLDPQRAVLMARAITDDLCRVDGDHALAYRTRGVAVGHALEALDEELEKRTAAWQGRSFVTVHDDFRYYAERYHLATARLAPAKAEHAALVTLDPIGGTSGVDTYEALLRWDTDALEKALSAPSATAPPNGPGH